MDQFVDSVRFAAKRFAHEFKTDPWFQGYVVGVGAMTGLTVLYFRLSPTMYLTVSSKSARNMLAGGAAIYDTKKGTFILASLDTMVKMTKGGV